MITNINYELIEKLLGIVQENEANMEMYQKSYSELKQPEQPEFVDEPLVWLSYIAELDEFEYDSKNILTGWEHSKAAAEEMKRKIIALLPANTWVKISGNRYIGYQTSSWPMYQPVLQIRGAEEKLKPLKHSND